MTYVKTIRAVLASGRFIAIDLHLHESAPHAVEVLMCLRPVERGIDVTLQPLQTPAAMTADQAFAFAWAKAQGSRSTTMTPSWACKRRLIGCPTARSRPLRRIAHHAHLSRSPGRKSRRTGFRKLSSL
jgi:hypothetical protein